jgi:uncharacterized membrane protein
LSAAARATAPTSGRVFDAERTIGRLLIAMTYVSVALMAIGVVLMFSQGISPLDQGPPLDPAGLLGEVTSLQPAGFLWLGLLIVIAAPIARVVLAAIAYAREHDRTMVAVSIAILVVLAVAVAVAVSGGA